MADPDQLRQRLSRISTCWTLLFQAHAGSSPALTAAQAAILERYRGAVYLYLRGATRDADVAEELAQEFALRFVRGDFHRANPKTGRFRDYVRVSLSHLVDDYHRARRAAPLQLAEGADPASPSETKDGSVDFVARWRAGLLDRTWEALEEASPPYKAALALRIAEPDLSSAQMAERLGKELGRPLTAEWVRKALQRAHEKFADLLVDEVAGSLGPDGEGELEAELTDLDLLRYCRSALARRRGEGGPKT
jgi:RNA polymerase sigma-70 factor (ECF subfamily)